jgi:hypothetical protein
VGHLRSARIGAAIAAATLLSLTIAGRAHAYIYWTDYALAQVGRVNLNGGGENDDFIGGTVVTPTGVAIDAHHIYWTDLTEGTIGRANLDGSHRNRRFITVTPRDPAGNDGGDNGGLQAVAVGASHIYWISNYPYPRYQIGRANLDGSGVIRDLIPAVHSDSPARITVAAGHIYWSDNYGGTISRANTDGSGVELGFIILPTNDPQSPPATSGVAVDGSHIYWAAPRDIFGFGTNTIGRANLDGSGVNPSLITVARGGLDDVAVDARHIYWSQEGGIGRANLDGSGVSQHFRDLNLGVAEQPDTGGIAVNAGSDPPTTDMTSAFPRLPVGVTRKRTVGYKFESDTPNSTFECKLRRAGPKRSVKRFSACHSPKVYTHLATGTYTFSVRAVNDDRVADPTPARDTFKVVR